MLGGELALPLTGVARVSRLIGNFDTTGKPYTWQVGDVDGSFFGNGCRNRNPDARKRHSYSEWRLNACAGYGHWPPDHILSAVDTVAPIAGFPAGFSLLRATRWRLLMPGARCCSGSLGVPPATDTSLAHIPLQSLFRSKPYFFSIICVVLILMIVSILVAKWRKFYKKA